MNRPIITLLTDFGLSDHYVGAMKGVMLSICPNAHLVDITHEVRPYAILDAAFTLAQACKYFPEGAIHLVVVDPGVGSSRRPLIAESHGHRFVAPDNGVLSLIGELRAWEIRDERFFRTPVSQTFHGRDIFAPVAAHLASGAGPPDFGPEIADPVCLPELEPVLIGAGEWRGTVLRIDRYGNVITNFASARFLSTGDSPVLSFQTTRVSQYQPTYSTSPPHQPVLIAGSSGYLEVSINKGDAASLLGISPGCIVLLKRAVQS